MSVQLFSIGIPVVAAALDPRFHSDGVYLLDLDSRSNGDQCVVFSTFLKVEGGMLFGSKQRDGPMVFAGKEPLSRLASVMWVPIDDPAGLLMLLRDPKSKMERVR